MLTPPHQVTPSVPIALSTESFDWISDATPSDTNTAEGDNGGDFPSSISLTSSLETPSVMDGRGASGGGSSAVDWGRLGRILKRDVVRFMVKRDAALAERRRGREMLLLAIRGVVSRTTLLSDGLGHEVTPYGSCRTGLDLPSSDLDIVLSRNMPPPPPSPTKNKKAAKKKELNRLKRSADKEMLELPYRIEQLAAKLSEQGWAVQVKPITTTAVPVIKILADPSMVPAPVAGGGTNASLTPTGAEEEEVRE